MSGVLDSPGVLRLVMGMVRSEHALCVPGKHENKLVRALQGKNVRGLRHAATSSVTVTPSSSSSVAANTPFRRHTHPRTRHGATRPAAPPPSRPAQTRGAESGPSCANDLKIDANLEGLWHLTAIKCDGPVGKWEIDGVVIGGGGLSGKEDIEVMLGGASLSGPWTSNGTVSAAGATRRFNESGTATYTTASDKKSGRLDFSPGSVPVTAGKFCKTAVPAGG